MAAATATAMTPGPLELFQQQAEEAGAFLQGTGPDQLRGKEKREMEKQLRRARAATRLLEQQKLRDANLSDENTDISTESGKYFWKIRSMAGGISDRQLPFWTFKVCDELGVDPMMRRHLSDQFLIVQAINAMANRIQEEWFAYKKRKARAELDPKFDYSLSAACLDPRRFTWHAGMDEPDWPSPQYPEEYQEEQDSFAEEEFVEETIPEEEVTEDTVAAVDTELDINVILSRLNSKSSATSFTRPVRESNYMSKTKAALNRENETNKPSRAMLRRHSVGGDYSGTLSQSTSRTGSFKDNSSTSSRMTSSRSRTKEPSNYMSKTKAALQRESETASKASKEMRKPTTIAEKESWRLQAKSRIRSMKDDKAT